MNPHLEPRPTPGRRVRTLLAGGAALLAGFIGAAVLSGGGSSPEPSLESGHLAEPSGTVDAATQAFFDRYVDGDGRVVRRDQGNDTVSEGQAYALLMAVSDGDRDRFLTVWRWTQAHLQRPDRLFAWRWAGGAVADSSPAADADVDIARALVLAGERFDAPDLTEAGVRVAAAILDHETLEAGGRTVLLAGPWAAANRVVNPSYFAPCAFAELEEATDDARWDALREDSVELLDLLTAGGQLPPDWARIDEAGRLVPTGPPGGSQGAPRYGLDAARVTLRMAERCDGDGRDIAARLWPRLQGLADEGAGLAYELDGDVVDQNVHPLGLVSAAAAASAAGDHSAAAQLYERAGALLGSHPTYYGAAWLALSRPVAFSGEKAAGPGQASASPDFVLIAAAKAPSGEEPPETTTTSPPTTTTTGPTTTTAPTTTTTARRSTTTTTRENAATVPPESTTTTTAPAGGDPAQAETASPEPPRGTLSQPPAVDRLIAPSAGSGDAGRQPEPHGARSGALLGGLASAALLGLLFGVRDRQTLEPLVSAGSSGLPPGKRRNE